MKKTLSIIVAFVLFSTMASAQQFGVRASLGYGTLSGPKAAEEKVGFNNGFHFGISYAQYFTDIVSLRAELGYFQTGYTYDFEGNSFYVFHDSEKSTFEEGIVDLNLENSLGYLSIPVVVNIKATNKIHFHAGGYVNFLVTPQGGGQIRFESSSRPDDIKFRQGLNYDYNSDGYFGEEDKSSNGTVSGAVILVDGVEKTLPRFVGAYYQYNNAKNGNYFNTVDAGLTFGAEYFLTRGFFAGVSMDYGLTDITNNNVDYDRTQLNDDKTFKYSTDFDRLMTIKASIGFRF